MPIMNKMGMALGFGYCSNTMITELAEIYIIKLNIIFHVKSSNQKNTFCVKSSDLIFFFVGLFPIVNQFDTNSKSY